MPKPRESFFDKQRRLQLEARTREIADVVKKMLPVGTGFVLFLADHGEKGNMAYVANVEREGAVNMTREWLAKLDEPGPDAS